MAATRLNAADQAIDVSGSLYQAQNYNLLDEPLGYGKPLDGQDGYTASIGNLTSTGVIVNGLTGMNLQSTGNFLQVSGASSSSNNGIFLIDEYISPTSVGISNPTAIANDIGTIAWIERRAYSLEDDLNYERTDRAYIKGVPYWAPIPTYTRPDNPGVNIPASLANIAGKTTDAISYNISRALFNQAVAASNTLITPTSAGNLQHSSAANITGIPTFDFGPFAGDYTSTFVLITDGYSNEMHVLTGPHAGERIFGLTYAGASTSPNSVEVRFFSAPIGGLLNGSTITPYTWEANQPTSINLGYAYNERLDQLDANAFRTVPTLGLISDASLEAAVMNLQAATGAGDGYSSLFTLLTNTSPNYVFSSLNATPSVVNALNILNSQIGDRSYTGMVLTSGETIASSLQALSNAITGSSITRIIERFTTLLPSNTPHTLPGGANYIPDNTDNGQGMYVYIRGKLADPGLVSGYNDYEETSPTSVTFYYHIKAGDHVNYFIK